MDITKVREDRSACEAAVLDILKTLEADHGVKCHAVELERHAHSSGYTHIKKVTIVTEVGRG